MVRHNLPEADLRAFLAAIHAAPDDDTPRLVFADWLEEHEDARGEMIRLSCRQATLPFDAPEARELQERLTPWDVGGAMFAAWLDYDDELACGVRGPVRGLLQVWIGADGGASYLWDYPRLAAAIEQGWVGEVRFRGYPSEVLSKVPDQLLSGTDVVVECDWRETSDGALEFIAQVPRLRELSLPRGRITDAGLAHLRGHPRLRRLAVDGEFTDAGLAHLRAVPNLEEAVLSGRTVKLRSCTAEPAAAPDPAT
jgi:uncharacterized protein (TIGR02996 family)